MADVIATAVLEIKTDLTQVRADLDKLKQHVKDTADSTSSIAENMNLEVFSEFAKISVEALAKVGEAIVGLAERGAKVQDVSEAFRDLSVKAGSTAEVMLGALRDGVRGTVSDFDLMVAANRALGAGVVKSSDDIKLMGEASLLLAKRTGTDTVSAFESMERAIITGRANKLKMLGVDVDLKAATEQYAASIGKLENQLIGAERQAATSQAMLAALRRVMADGHSGAVDFGDVLESLRARFVNLRDGIAAAVASSPALKAGLLAVGVELDRAFGTDKDAQVKAVVKTVDSLALGLVTVAKAAVETGRYVGLAFDNAKFVFNAFLESVYAGEEKLTRGLLDLVGALAKLPGGAAMFAPVQKELRAHLDLVHSLRTGFGQMADGAQRSAANTNAAADKIGGALDRVRAAMVKAQGETAKAADEVKKRAPDLGGAGVDKFAEDNARKVAEAFNKLQRELAGIGRTGVDKRLSDLKYEEQQELLQLERLKVFAGAKYGDLERMVREKYRLMAQDARNGVDSIEKAHAKLQADVLAMTQTGEQRKLTEIEAARQKDIDGLEHLKMRYGAEYAAMVALVNQKYALMAGAATGSYATVALAAEAAGFKERTVLETTAARAVELYNSMRASGQFTAEEVASAWERAEKARRAAGQMTRDHALEMGKTVLESTSTIMQTLGIRNKAVSIAAAIISTYQAVAKTWATLGWPAAIPGALAALAAGMANVARIRSSSHGYKQGTPELDFQDFGKITTTQLHGQEAVIPAGGGHRLAQEIAAAMPAATSDNMARLVSTIKDAVSGNAAKGQEVNAVFNVDGRRLGEIVFQLSKTGALRVNRAALVNVT